MSLYRNEVEALSPRRRLYRGQLEIHVHPQQVSQGVTAGEPISLRWASRSDRVWRLLLLLANTSFLKDASWHWPSLSTTDARIARWLQDPAARCGLDADGHAADYAFKVAPLIDDGAGQTASLYYYYAAWEVESQVSQEIFVVRQ